RKAKKIIALLEGTGQPSAKGPEASPGKPAELWERIEAWLQRHKPKLTATLNRGASPKQLALVEKTTGCKLTEELKEAYRIPNGQKGGGDLVPPLAANEMGYFLMPIADIVDEWKSWKQLVDGGEFEGKASGPDEGIQDAWWHPGWVPFASNGG